MATQIYVNLPVKDLDASIQFFTKLGFSFNPRFTDETASCMIVSDDIFVMLLTHEKFKMFTPKAICDSTTAAEVLLSISCESRERVDEIVAQALDAGGSTHDEPEDYGFMYTHSFLDLDGHNWGLLFMVPGADAPH